MLHDLQSIRNHGRQPARLALELRFRSKFQDLFVVKGFVRQAQGSLRAPRVVGKDRVELSYEGKDGLFRTTTLVFSPPPARLDGERATFEFALPPGKAREIAITITPPRARARPLIGRRPMPRHHRKP